MASFLVEAPFGIVAIDEKGGVIDKIVTGKDHKQAAQWVLRVRSGQVPAEVRELLGRLKAKGIREVTLLPGDLASALRGFSEIIVRVEQALEPVAEFEEKLSREWKGRREWLGSCGLELSILKNFAAYKHFIHEVNLQVARLGIAAAGEKRDLHAVQAVRTIDDLDKSLNLFAGRIREWYGLHFPELDRLVDKHETYIRLVSKLGNRRNFTLQSLVGEGLPKDRAAEIARAAASSMGAETTEHDFESLQSFCKEVLELGKFRESAERYVEQVMKEAAPNIAAILGPTLSARLIAIAGGLENLAKMPASTLQVLGAEKALFRAIRTGAKPPKHGVIFQYAPLHQSPRSLRGKIARALSGKLSIASRIDAFGGENLGERLTADLNRRIEEIKRRDHSLGSTSHHESRKG